MKIDASTKVHFDQKLVRVSEPVLKHRLGRTDTGQLQEYEEAQIRIENVADCPLSDLRVEFQYFDSGRKFLGTDDDLRGEVLEQGASWVATTVLDFPHGASAVAIQIECRPYALRDRIAQVLRNPFVAILLFVFLAIAGFMGRRF